MKLNRNFRPGGKSALGLIAGVLALGVATASDSDGMGTNQQSKMDCDSKNMAKDHPMKMDPVARAKQQLSELKTNLNLTKEQEPALQTFSDQVNEQAKVTASIQEKLKDISSKNAPEHMAMMADAAKTRAENMTKKAESVKTFYRTLNQEQQATFDKTYMSQQMSYMGQMSHPGQKGDGQKVDGQKGEEQKGEGQSGERGERDELSEMSH